MTDRELLRVFLKQRTVENFRPILERFLGFVHAAARRQTPSEEDAQQATRAVFLALAKRPRWVPRRAPLAGWLFRVTKYASRKVRRDARKAGRLMPGPAPSTDGSDSWPALAPHIDARLDGLPDKLRDVLLVRLALGRSVAEAAETLRIRERRVDKRMAKGLRKLLRRLRKASPGLDVNTLALHLKMHGRAGAVPENLAEEIISAIPVHAMRGPFFAVTRRTLAALTLARWQRRFKLAMAGVGALVVLIGALAATGYFLSQTGRLFPLIAETMIKLQARTAPELTAPARPWPVDPNRPLPSAAAVRSGADLFQTTNIWTAHLKFSREEWQAVQPRRIPSLPNAFQPGGKFILRNPQAKRSGLSGVIGYEFDWARANLDFGGTAFENVAARIKGNGTFLGSLWGLKRSFKVDLDKFNKENEFGDVEVINFTNLIEDRSYMADALAHEFFRDSGIPAPRTAYAYLTLSAEGEFERKPLGLYLLVENLDGSFAKDRFGKKSAPIFKPVTYELFQDMGDDWAEYAPVYDLKTKASEAQQRRVVEFSKLLSHADDAEFARRLGEFLDLDEFARFLGGLVLVASYDGFFSNGQNFYVYLDPRSNKFGFIAWDLDHAWGNFPFIGTADSRERASIWHPWVGEHLFLERVMKVEEFRKIYRARLEEMLATTFGPGRLNARIDAIAASIREAVGAESKFRLARLEEAVSEKVLPRWEGDPFDIKRTAHQLKRFVGNRAKSVRDQLDGKSKGMILSMTPPGGGGE